MKKVINIILFLMVIAGCTNNEVKRNYNVNENPKIKRKIRIEEFENKSKYKLKQVSSSMNKVVQSEANLSNRFQILERDEAELKDIKDEVMFSSSNVKRENQNLKKNISLKEAEFSLKGTINYIGLEKTESFFNERQKTYSEVQLRLMDLKDGKTHVFQGEAKLILEHPKSIGYNEKDIYEANKEATIIAMNKLIESFDKMPWSMTGILNNNEVFIPIGVSSNLKLGTKLKVFQKGESLYIGEKFIGYSEEKIGIIEVKEYINNGEVSRCVFLDKEKEVAKGQIFVRE